MENSNKKDWNRLYTFINSLAFKELALKPIHLSILAGLARYLKIYSTCQMTRSKLAKYCRANVSEKTISRAIKTLIEKGILIVHKESSTNIYSIPTILPNEFTEITEFNSKYGDKMSHARDILSPVTPFNNININNNKYNTTQSSRFADYIVDVNTNISEIQYTYEAENTENIFDEKNKGNNTDYCREQFRPVSTNNNISGNKNYWEKPHKKNDTSKTKQKKSKQKSKYPGNYKFTKEQVTQVFTDWVTIMNHPRAVLSHKRRRNIEQSLSYQNLQREQTYTPERIKIAILGCRYSEYHQGKGENKSGTIYDDIELICRDPEHLDAFIKKGEQALRKRQTISDTKPTQAMEMITQEIKSQDEIFADRQKGMEHLANMRKILRL